MAARTLTAMYDTKGAAEGARDDLVALGLASADVTIRGADAGTGAASGATASTGTEDKGFWASLADLFVPDEDRSAYAEGVRRGGYLLSARVPDGMEDRAAEVLERHDPVDVDERSRTWSGEGWSREGYRDDAATTGATGGGLGAARTREDGVVERAEEQLRVGKREVGRGSVRVRSYVVEQPVEEQVDLRQERVTIERRPVDREVAPGEAAFQERTIEAVERGEEAVVDKTARVTEEIGIRKDVERETETVRDTVRKQEVEVEDDRAGRDLAGEERVTTTRDRTAG
jgi:uncharacterized protein (TIGR02271 family)